MSKIETATKWMENLANNPAHGYDQANRWGEKGDYDCSSAVITAWQTAGVPVKSGGATTTHNMRAVFLKNSFKDVTSTINLATGGGLKRGDVLLNTANHTSMFCGNGKQVYASKNENGQVLGGKPGDQNGKEILIANYYNFPWNHVLRYNGVDDIYVVGKKYQFLQNITLFKGSNVKSGWVMYTDIPVSRRSEYAKGASGEAMVKKDYRQTAKDVFRGSDGIWILTLRGWVRVQFQGKDRAKVYS